MTTSAAVERAKGWAAPMALYLLGIFMGAIDTGIITPARPVIAKDLGVDEASGVWMITIYTLGYAASIPVMGKLADRLGRKRIYLISIAIFGVGSLLCGLSQDVGSFGMLIASRALQAIGGGGILPIATAEVGTSVPPARRGMALGLVGGVYGIANIFGASAGSLVLDVVGSHNWQWIFYINIPISIAIVAAGWFVLPDHVVGDVKKIDVLGTLLLVGIILSLLYGIKNLDFFDVGTSLASVEVWPFLVGCLVALPVFVLAERRAEDPVLNLRYFTNRGIGLTLVLSMLSGLVLMAVVFVPQLAENALGIAAGKGGYFVIALGLASGIGAPMSGRLTDRFGPKAVLGLGMGLSAIAAASVVWWTIPHPSMTSVLVSLALIGLGLGFVVGSPLNYMMLERTPQAESASALGTLSLVRAIGTTLAPAIMVGFLAQGASGLQDDLTAELPTTVQVPTLPHAVELTQRIERWKSDDNLKDKLADVAVPDLTRTEVTIDPKGGGELPDDLVELLRTADVTNITERTKVVAERMFSTETPATIADIQAGVDSGVAGLRTGLEQTGTARQEMTDGLASMDANLTDMGSGLGEMDRAIAEMRTGLAGMDKGEREMGAGLTKMGAAITGMTTGITKMDGTLAEMASGLSGMDDGLAGLDAARAGVAKPIAGLDTAIAGMDSGLAQQQPALAQLEAAPVQDPTTAGKIAGLRAGIADLTAQREAAVAQRTELRGKLDAINAERSTLAGKRAELAKGHAALKAERDKLIAQRTKLTSERAKLVAARDKLAAERAKLAAARAKLTAERGKLADGMGSLGQARDELAAARTDLDATRAELELTITQMGELRAAVPGAFDRALAGYLAEIDDRSPQLEATFAAGIGEGFRGVYLFDLVICLLSLGVIVAVPRARAAGPAGDQP